jgi:hypothetical protein
MMLGTFAVFYARGSFNNHRLRRNITGYVSFPVSTYQFALVGRLLHHTDFDFSIFLGGGLWAVPEVALVR